MNRAPLSLTENAAVLAPWAHLTPKQQQLLLDIDPMKTARVTNGWIVRGTKFAKGTVDKLNAKRLVEDRIIFGRERLALTYAGRIAVSRLEEYRRGER
ncbi:hypothetical protein [Sinorhizobium fredii]|uniref:hypothetical protein n=1 Tax=Rhizobium fredii TaxID=380 RepID=UPI0004B3B5D0|nr:hypothetical protein [Sinorhizobium fredii]ASY69360.1 hypothetical protein SF83666_c19440 [Sinorhizobium fredii CCBAU 83666]